MAVRKKLADYDDAIAKLLEKVEQEKEERKKVEEQIKSEIGKEYFTFMRLENSKISVDEVLEKLKASVKQKRLEKKNNNNI